MYALAGVYLRAKKPLQAQRQLRSLLEIRPTDEPARELLALALLDEGKSDAARQEYQQLERLTQKATTKTRCRILLDPALRGDPAGRRRILLEAIEASGPDAEAWTAVAETYEDTDPQKAREYFSRAVSLDPDDEVALLGIVRADQHGLRFEQVAAGLEQLLNCHPNRHAWRRMLVGMYSLLEQFDSAVSLADQQEARTDLDPARRTEYRETLVETLREAGRRDEAIARLQVWAKEEAESGEWTQRLALEYVRQRKYKDAIRTYESIYEVAPENKAVRDRLLDSLLEIKRHVRAEQYLVQWYAEEPQNERLVLALAQIVSRAGRVDESIELINTWLTRTSRREPFQNLLVSVLAAAGRHEECAQLLEELSDEAMIVVRYGGDPTRLPPQEQMTDERRTRLPNEPYSVERLHERLESLRTARISALGNAKRFRDAQQLLDESMQGNPDPMFRLELLARQAMLYRLQGREDEAVEVLQTALPMRANTESLNNDIAYSWIDRGIKTDEAETLIKFALGRIPRQAAYLDTYGWLLYKKGDFEGAWRWLSRANRVRGGDDPVIYDHLGDTQWRLGKRDDAVTHWQKAVELIQDRTENELTNDDERRVSRTTKQKIDDARSSEGPKIAPLAGEPPLKSEETTR
jgi:tetratricopeptide (TPR) repeat protein